MVPEVELGALALNAGPVTTGWHLHLGQRWRAGESQLQTWRFETSLLHVERQQLNMLTAAQFGGIVAPEAKVAALRTGSPGLPVLAPSASKKSHSNWLGELIAAPLASLHRLVRQKLTDRYGTAGGHQGHKLPVGLNGWGGKIKRKSPVAGEDLKRTDDPSPRGSCISSGSSTDRASSS